MLKSWRGLGGRAQRLPPKMLWLSLRSFLACFQELAVSEAIVYRQKLLFTDKASTFLPSLPCLLPSFLISFFPSFLSSFLPSLPSSLASFLASFFLPSFRPSFLPPLLPSFLLPCLPLCGHLKSGIKCLHNRPECVQDQTNQTPKIQTIKIPHVPS